MAHATLYINGTYVSDLENLRQMVRKNQKDRFFRLELLTLFFDNILEKWFEERNLPFVVCDYDSHSALDCFRALFKAIVGEPCNVDLSSKINEYIELDRVLFGMNSYPFNSQNVGLPFVDTDDKLTFVFRQQGSNEVFHLSLRKKGELLCEHDLLLDQLIGSHTECSIEFEFKKSWMEIGEELELVEGENNLLCQITFEPKWKREIRSTDGNGSLYLYKIPETGYWMTEIIKPSQPQLGRIGLPQYIGAFSFSTLDVDNVRQTLNRNYFVGFSCPDKDIVEKARETMCLDSVFENYTLLLVYFNPKGGYSSSIVGNDIGRYAHDKNYATVFVVSDDKVRHYLGFCKK